LDVRIANDERRVAELAGESNQVAVEGVELAHARVQGGGDVQRILRTQRVVVPNLFAPSLSTETRLRERSNTQTT
jgi:hypothetical protein